MAMTDYLEQARAAQCTLLRRTETAGAGQDDVTAPAFLAWDKQDQAGRCLDAVLAMPAVLTSQALRTTSRDAPRPLHSFLAGIRTMVPPVEADLLLGTRTGQAGGPLHAACHHYRGRVTCRHCEDAGIGAH